MRTLAHRIDGTDDWVKLLVRADGAGASHGLLDWLTSLNTAREHGHRQRVIGRKACEAIDQPAGGIWIDGIAHLGPVDGHDDHRPVELVLNRH
jgi:hypothetical protein